MQGKHQSSQGGGRAAVMRRPYRGEPEIPYTIDNEGIGKVQKEVETVKQVRGKRAGQ
jgi:hypothetical protein